ncbi:MAG: FHA domain-containing protein [Planctomycetes bacterium]|nr:FHA domain-containing protein [Planctomycetota bacterium]
MSDTQGMPHTGRLSIQRPDKPVEEYAVTQSTVTVGRVKTNEITITGDTAISREHCRFSIDLSTLQATVRDLGSSNGTFLNGEPIGTQPVQIKAGDKIHVGATIITFTIDRHSGTIPLKKTQPKRRFGQPFTPVEGEEEKTRFENGVCTCGRCGSQIDCARLGPGDKIGCARCRAVWTLPASTATP